MSSRRLPVGGGVELRVLVRQGVTGHRALLVHGLASNARLWDGVGDRLATAGMGSVAVDLRGHGESDRPDGGYDFATISCDLEAVLDHFGGSWVLAGQSWGANVVLDLAARRATGITGLVLVDGGFIKLAEEYPDPADAEAHLRPPDLRGLTRRALEEGAARRFPGWPEEGIAGQLANFEDIGDGRVRPRLSLDRHLAILRALHGQDPDLLAGRIHVPVRIVAVGEPGSRPRVQAFADRLHAGSVLWVDGHHDIHAQQPELVAKVIEEVG